MGRNCDRTKKEGYVADLRVVLRQDAGNHFSVHKFVLGQSCLAGFAQVKTFACVQCLRFLQPSTTT